MKRVISCLIGLCIALTTFAQVSYTVKAIYKSSPVNYQSTLTANPDLDDYPLYLGPPVDDLNVPSRIGARSNYLGPPAGDLMGPEKLGAREAYLGPPAGDLLGPVRDVSFIELGQAGNAFGFFGNGRTNIWADDHINSISFVHRMVNPPGSGYLSYDLSVDGGNTWTTNIQVYDPTLSVPGEARYPQCAIYNPVGNTFSGNAFFTYFAPTLDGSNTSGDLDWGGYGYGVHKLDQTQQSTQHNQTSTGNYYQQIPNALTITQDGVLWMIDSNEESDGSGSYNYTDELIIGKGVFNPVTMDYDYTQFLFDAPIYSEDVVNDLKVAFAPDGQTGYIMMLSEIEPMLYSSYHPILYKTTDGGETWDDDPIEVELGGPYGIEAIKYWLSDEMLANFFEPPVPERDSIMYFAGYHGDLAVDYLGNPHITVMIAIAIDDSFYSPADYIATFHIYSNDGGDTWDATHLKTLKTFDGDFTGSGQTITMYNNPQVATTMDGTKLFFSCLDTDFEGMENNTNPDMYVTACNLIDHTYSDCLNVTQYTQAWMIAWFGSMSHYVFSENIGNTEVCTVPLVYEEMDESQDPTLPVSFWYIKGCQFSFSLTGTEEVTADAMEVSQNYPNPFSDQTLINFTLTSQSAVDLDVYSITGQLVLSRHLNSVEKGTHQIAVRSSDLGPGVYFYNLTAQGGTVTRKMIVQ
jgi:hypothetical protein